MEKRIIKLEGGYDGIIFEDLENNQVQSLMNLLKKARSSQEIKLTLVGTRSSTVKEEVTANE